MDFLAAPLRKWLCGPDGLAALYVRRERVPQLAAAQAGGNAAERFDYDGDFSPEHASVRKFELGTMSGALLAGGVAALELHRGYGAAAVFERALALARYAEARFEQIERVTMLSPRAEQTRCGLFCLRAEGLSARALAAFLQHAGVICRAVRQYDAVRLSLHAFNVEAEIRARRRRRGARAARGHPGGDRGGGGGCRPRRHRRLSAGGGRARSGGGRHAPAVCCARGPAIR